MPPCTTFHRFPELPSELRIRIYEYALTAPRTVVITCQREKIKGIRQYNETFVSKTPVPPLLRTSRESRFEALKVYTPTFRTETSPNYTYINFEQDAVDCVDRVLQYLRSDVREQIQQMMVHVNDAALFWHFHMERIMQMSSLKLLDILASQENISWSTGRRWVDGLINDIGLTKEKYSDWVSPRVTVLEKDTKEVLAKISGGPWIDPENEEGQQ